MFLKDLLCARHPYMTTHSQRALGVIASPSGRPAGPLGETEQSTFFRGLQAGTRPCSSVSRAGAGSASVLALGIYLCSGHSLGVKEGCEVHTNHRYLGKPTRKTRRRRWPLSWTFKAGWELTRWKGRSKQRQQPRPKHGGENSACPGAGNGYGANREGTPPSPFPWSHRYAGTN